MERRHFLGLVAGSMVGLAGCSGDSEPSDEEDTVNTQTQTTTEEPVPTTTEVTKNLHEEGESFVVGSQEEIQYKITDSYTTDSLGESATADGIFVVIKLEITNKGQEAIHISTNHFRLTDSQNRKYETDSDAFFALDNTIMLRELTPGISQTAQMVFDVPENQSDRQLKVNPTASGSSAEPHFVDLNPTRVTTTETTTEEPTEEEPEPTEEPTEEEPDSFKVKIEYSGEWQGALSITGDGSSETRSVSGSGTEEFDIEPPVTILSANAQKQDDSSETLTIQIIQNGEVVSESSTSAEYGVAQVSKSFF